MPTARQKKLAQEIVRNSQQAKPEPLGVLLESVGYSVSTAEAKPGEIIAQKGVQEELNALGFTEENAKAVVAKVLLSDKAENRDRLKAAELTFKVHGSFQPEDSNDKNPRVVNIFNNPTFAVATQAYEQSLKQLIAQNATPAIPTQTTDTAANESGADPSDTA